ncbi:hypothetical protein PCE1_002640 [Barthelona sp. PCE]
MHNWASVLLVLCLLVTSKAYWEPDYFQFNVTDAMKQEGTFEFEVEMTLRRVASMVLTNIPNWLNPSTFTLQITEGLYYPTDFTVDDLFAGKKHFLNAFYIIIDLESAQVGDYVRVDINYHYKSLYCSNRGVFYDTQCLCTDGINPCESVGTTHQLKNTNKIVTVSDDIGYVLFNGSNIDGNFSTTFNHPSMGDGKHILKINMDPINFDEKNVDDIVHTTGFDYMDKTYFAPIEMYTAYSSLLSDQASIFLSISNFSHPTFVLKYEIVIFDDTMSSHCQYNGRFISSQARCLCFRDKNPPLYHYLADICISNDPEDVLQMVRPGITSGQFLGGLTHRFSPTPIFATSEGFRNSFVINEIPQLDAKSVMVVRTGEMENVTVSNITRSLIFTNDITWIDMTRNPRIIFEGHYSPKFDVSMSFHRFTDDEWRACPTGCPVNSHCNVNSGSCVCDTGYGPYGDEQCGEMVTPTEIKPNMGKDSFVIDGVLRTVTFKHTDIKNLGRAAVAEITVTGRHGGFSINGKKYPAMMRDEDVMLVYTRVHPLDTSVLTISNAQNTSIAYEFNIPICDDGDDFMNPFTCVSQYDARKVVTKMRDHSYYEAEFGSVVLLTNEPYVVMIDPIDLKNEYVYLPLQNPIFGMYTYMDFNSKYFKKKVPKTFFITEPTGMSLIHGAFSGTKDYGHMRAYRATLATTTELNCNSNEIEIVNPYNYNHMCVQSLDSIPAQLDISIFTNIMPLIMLIVIVVCIILCIRCCIKKKRMKAYSNQYVAVHDNPMVVQL